MNQLGITLRRLRLESGLSLRDLARRLGVSSAYLSRVEHGLDPAPTPERLEAVAAELGLPPALLLEVGHRVSPFVQRYLDHEPQAGALFLEIARRGLGAEELLEVQRFVERRFPDADLARSRPEPRLAPLLDEARTIVGLRCGALDDAYELGSTRLAALPSMPSPADLAGLFAARDDEIGAGVGGGVGVLCAAVPDARPTAALVLLATPVRSETPDEVPIEVLVLLVLRRHDREALHRIAHVARLAARGLAPSLAGVRQPSEALRRIALLELVG